MSESANFKILSAEILSRSVAEDWPSARLEWVLIDVYEDQDKIFKCTCLCSHSPISEICVLRNKLTGTEVEVGNVCVKRFMGLNSHKVFDGIRRIRKNSSKGLAIDAANLFYRKGLITEWEHTFSSDTWRKRSLSTKQQLKREHINRRVLANVKRARL